MEEIYDPKRLYPEFILKAQKSALEAEVSDHIVNPAALTIATHTGSFHCAEVLAIAMLRVLPEFSHSRIF